LKTRTYSDAREHLATLVEDVIARREVVMITRPGYEPVAIIPAGYRSNFRGKRQLEARKRVR
jgi:PHD/YefM family antitoxin component YafN of YafNO toxin-antitoxin module